MALLTLETRAPLPSRFEGRGVRGKLTEEVGKKGSLCVRRVGSMAAMKYEGKAEEGTASSQITVLCLRDVVVAPQTFLISKARNTR